MSGQKETISFLTKKKKHDSDVRQSYIFYLLFLLFQDDAEEEEEKVEPKNKITSDAEQKKKVEVNMQRVSLVPCFFRERGDANITSKLEKFYSSRSIQINKWKTARDAFKKVRFFLCMCVTIIWISFLASSTNSQTQNPRT